MAATITVITFKLVYLFKYIYSKLVLKVSVTGYFGDISIYISDTSSYTDNV